MNMQGLMAVLEEDKADLVGRRETHFVSVPLTGVQLEVLQVFSIVISLSAPPGALYTMAQLISSNNYHITERTNATDILVSNLSQVRMVEGVAEVSVVQEYMNREEKAMEVIYFFPIEEGAALTKVEAEVEGRKVVGKVKEKEKAKEEYRNATSRGHTAVMVEEVKADILEVRVGRLAAGAGCRVSLMR